MLYFYLAFVALLFSGVISQECKPFTGTWTKPQVCNPTYLTTESVAADPTAGDALSSFFSSLSSLPSKSCSEAYSAYYCTKNYPQCAADNTTVEVQCREACVNAITMCEGLTDSALFGGDFPLPALQQCAPLNGDSDCIIPTADLSNFYADCGEYELNRTRFDVTLENHIICRPDYTVPVANLTNANYAAATNVFNTFREVSRKMSEVSLEVTDSEYPCFKHFSNYFCSIAFPPCNENEAFPLKAICASTCHQVITDCANYTEFFAAAGVISLPEAATCDSLPVDNCFSPVNNTYVGFYFGNNDPPVPIIPTLAPESSDDSYDKYPPGGPGKGGGIGAGVLAGLLLIIGLVMLIMKKQDSR